MSKLQILPGNIANMIAAGEVVQRPASVVKELMENAVDAGASALTVIITDAGRTLIQVIDDGVGMSSEDALLCFERHATSKIATAEDLNAILTYGFRGEALASIAAVAEVCLKTRRQEDEVGTELNVSFFEKGEPQPVSMPVGSNFSIRNLFYNTPARRKFLKSDNVEFRHIVEEFTRVALTRPEIAFTLIHNGKEVYVLKKAKSLKYRVTDLLGNSLVGDLVDIQSSTNVLKISGFLGSPSSSRKTLGNQYFFVNGRYFRSPYLHKAVMKAYEEYLPEGVTPTYLLYLEIEPNSIDVNIHPTKSEIKFEEDSIVFQIICAAVKEALGRNAFGVGLDFEAESAINIPVIGKHFDEYKPISEPQAEIDPNYNPFELGPIAPNYEFDKIVEKREDYGKLFEEKTLPSTQVIVLQGKYIICQTRSGIMAVNIRRAKERIMYDRFVDVLSKGTHVSQTSLFPTQLTVGVQARLLLEENSALLSSLGFEITPFGDDAVVVGRVPEGFSCEQGKVQTMLDNILLILSEDTNTLSEVMIANLAARFAILGATDSDIVSSPYQAQHLVDSLLSCDNSEFTHNGKRIIYFLSLEEIEKKFQ